MIDHDAGATPTIVAVSVNNTRTRFGATTIRLDPNSARAESADAFESSGSVLTADGPEAAGDRIAALAAEADADVVAIATVNPEASEPLRDRLRSNVAVPVAEVHRDLALPLNHTLTDASTLGQDRALNALAAFARAGQACVVVDAGTAITVDFVDGEGTFHGGVILPGAQMMLDALASGTASLPGLRFTDRPDPLEPFGKDTAGAMFQGAVAGARGAVRYAVEAYAEFYGAFAQVIATGGDAPTLFEEDGLVEAIVPDLTLLGIAECVRRSLAGEPSTDDE